MEIEKIIETAGSLIEKEMKAVFPRKSVPNLYDGIWYHLETGGKKLRPAIAIATCDALGGDTKKVIPFAAACEVMHNWFLIHDDIEDGDRVRRDKPTVWVQYGVAHAINIGDVMAQKVYELVMRSDVDEKTVMKLMSALIETSVKTAEGQALDINLRESEDPQESEYMEMVIGKTAHYLTVPIVGGAIISGADEETIKKIIKFGSYIGPAFQIVDDLLDLTEGKGRGEIGRDVKEGKRSILVIHCVLRCGRDEKKKLFAILDKKPDETTKDDVLYAKRLFEKYGSIDYAKKKAVDLTNKAKKVTGEMPPALREVLDFFADYILTRKK